MHSSLHRGSVEEFGITLSLLQPPDPRFLLPIYFLLFSPFLELVVNASFLFLSCLRVPLCDYLLMEIREFLIQILLSLKNVAEGLPIPSL